MNISSNPALRVLVRGEVACFRRPEFTNDFVSYDVMPPTAARRLVESVYSIESECWLISSIQVLKPVRFQWDEIVTVRGRRRALVLIDVAYLIEASPQSTANGGYDHTGAFDAALKVGAGRAHLGLIDFPASLENLPNDVEPPSDLTETGTIDLGWMLYNTAKGKPAQFFRANMTNGVIDLSRIDSLTLAS